MKKSKTESNASLKVSLKDLYEASVNPLNIAREYLWLAEKYPTTIRTIVFHTRRILKHSLLKFQLMEECLASASIADIRKIFDKIAIYQSNPKSFEYDKEKAHREKEALEKKKREEGKRKAYEARMLRKAKREGREDLDYYLRLGSDIPTITLIESLKKLPKEKQLKVWKESHSQHCLAYHLDPNGCSRDRKCAFLHSDARRETTFFEDDECCG